MAQDLALILETPIEELIPKMLAWNNTELLAKVEQTLKQYEGVTYDENQVGIAKTDRAQLNAFCKALNDERIRIGKIYNSPYDKFKTEVDEVIHRVQEVIQQIDGQVKNFELEKQQKKQNDIIEYYKEVIGDFSGCIPYERVHQAKWLNASTSMKSIKADIDKIIEDAKNAIIAIEALKSEDEATLKAFYFRTLNISAALLENERLRKEREQIAELKAKQAEQAKQAAIQEEPIKAEPAIEQKTQTVRFQVEGTVEQLKALQLFLRENKIKFTAIKEEN